jgi:hypothetical protein
MFSEGVSAYLQFQWFGVSECSLSGRYQCSMLLRRLREFRVFIGQFVRISISYCIVLICYFVDLYWTVKYTILKAFGFQIVSLGV